MSAFTCPACNISYGGDSIAETTPSRRRLSNDAESVEFDLCQKCADKTLPAKRLQVIVNRVKRKPAEYVVRGAS